MSGTGSNEHGKHKLILDTIIGKVNFLASSDNSIDSKAGALLGFLITLLIGYLGLILKFQEQCPMYISLFGLFLLTISITLLFIVVWPKKYTSISVKLNRIKKEYLQHPRKELLKQLIVDTQNAFDKNKVILERKTKFFKFAIILLAVAVALFTLSLIIQIFCI